MRFQINDTRDRLQMGPIIIALRRHAILSFICWVMCIPRFVRTKHRSDPR
jgi:hypothetical protein